MFSNSFINIFSTIIFSLIIILFFQYGWNYLKDNYSVKKTKDLVNTQIEKYKKIAESTINDSQGPPIVQGFPIVQGSPNMEGSQNIDFISETEKQTMNDDLMNLANSL